MSSGSIVEMEGEAMEVLPSNGGIKRKTRTSSTSSDDSLDSVIENKVAKTDVNSTYLVSGVDVKLSKLNPIKVKQWLDNLVGQCKISPDKNGNLIVMCGVSSENVLLNIKKFENHKISVTRHMQTEFQKGIIHGVSEDFSDDDLKSYLSAADKTIIDAKRLGLSRSVVVTFSGSVLPSHVFYGYLRFSVKLFIPNPIRCFKCQRFGHIAAKCRSSVRCGNCGDNHDTKECEMESAKCCNCGGDHRASSRECKYFDEAKVIIRVKTEQKISYAAAVKKMKVKRDQTVLKHASAKSSVQTGSSVKQNTPPSLPHRNEPALQPALPFNWNDFTAFMVKASFMFSGKKYQNKTDIERISVFAELIKEFFHVQVDKNQTCHALFDQDKTLTASGKITT